MDKIAPEYLNGIITIIGFIVSYFLTKRNIKSETQKQKIQVYLDELSKAPLEFLELLDFVIDGSDQTVLLSKMKSVFSKVFAYSSNETANILTEMQVHNYMIGTKNFVDYKVIAYNALLICQIKYDLTGIKTNPNTWYRMKLKDYLTIQQKLVSENNKIVKELRLKRFLHISI